MNGADLSPPELAFARAMVHTIEAHDRYLAAALERLEGRFEVPLESLPAGALVDLALRLEDRTGPSPYLAIPHRLIESLGLDSYPLEFLTAPGPAGFRCCSLIDATGTPNVNRDLDHGVDWWCLLPARHAGAHGWEFAYRQAIRSHFAGTELEFDDAGETAELVDALERRRRKTGTIAPTT